MPEESALKKNYAKLKKFYAATGFRIPFTTFVAMFAAIGLLAFIILFLLKLSLLIATVSFFTFLSFVVAIPLAARNSRIEAIETNLPDAIKHMALVLKSGGTTESALEEVANADYGSLSVDLKQSLKQLREGKSFDAVMSEAAANSGSLLYERVITIVLDAKKAGAGLADVMLAIAEDARDTLHIKRERKSRTTMHVLFLFTSSVLLSPFIFGFTISIVNYIREGMAAAIKNAPESNMCALHSLLSVFIIAQTLVAVLTIGLIREGRFTKYLLYAPILVLAALMIFEAGKWLSTMVVNGSPIPC